MASPNAKLLLTLPLILIWQTTLFSQSVQRVVEKVSWQTEPVKIQKIKTNGTIVELGKKFRAEKNWLNGLTISTQNTSNKAIARIEISLAFPRGTTASTDTATYTVQLIYGLDPADFTGDIQSSVLPGETVEVRLPKGNLATIQDDLASLNYVGEVTRVRLMVNSVTFIDGSMWAGDEILYPDPANPRQKINPRLQNGPRVPNEPYLSRARHVMPNLLLRLFSHPLAMQDASLPCNTVFVTTQTNDCGDTGSGCTFKLNVFDDRIELLGLRNARKELSSTRCQKSDGTFCTTTLISNFARLPCGAKIAGSCGGAPDYNTYPSTGCASGFTVIGGVCTRSLTFQSKCAGPSYYDPDTCSCPDGVETSPIVIDVDHSGFSLTDAYTGVVFDVLNDGVALQVSWTDANSTNSFLALDRNGNGTIDNGQELFGNVTPQPQSSAPNGFVALAEYDKAVNGGNRDGKIDRHDSVFAALKLWRDANHNGQSESNELRPLSESLRAIDLNYKESKRTDQYGNRFTYRARVYDLHGVQGGRWAWDVFLNVY